jgi:hypothetical protein
VSAEVAADHCPEGFVDRRRLPSSEVMFGILSKRSWHQNQVELIKCQRTLIETYARESESMCICAIVKFSGCCVMKCESKDGSSDFVRGIIEDMSVAFSSVMRVRFHMT